MQDRINVIGSCGAGKSTVTKALSKKLGHPVVELDRLFWRANWSNVSDDEMVQQLNQQLTNDTWILDGNFGKFEAVKWKRVQTVVWVDTPFPKTLWQLTLRCIKRAWTKEELWAEGSGCRESFKLSFFSKESVILYMIKEFWQYRKTYEEYIKSNRYPHIQWVRLRNRKQVDDFIKSFP